jgi:hypothetical protein
VHHRLHSTRDAKTQERPTLHARVRAHNTTHRAAWSTSRALRLPIAQSIGLIEDVQVAPAALAIAAATHSKRACHPTILVMSVATSS